MIFSPGLFHLGVPLGWNQVAGGCQGCAGRNSSLTASAYQEQSEAGPENGNKSKTSFFNNFIYWNDVSFLPGVLSPPWEVAEGVDCPQTLPSWMEMAGASCSWGVHVWPAGPEGGWCCPPHLTGHIQHYFLGYHLCRRLHHPHTETKTKSITFLFCHIFASIGIKMGPKRE